MDAMGPLLFGTKTDGSPQSDNCGLAGFLASFGNGVIHSFEVAV